MAEYEVRYKILEPDSMDRNGKVKFRNTGYLNSPLTVTADSPEEAKKVARKSTAITNALSRARDNTPSNVLEVARPRVQFGEITTKGSRGGGGGGAMPQTPGDIIGRGRPNVTKAPAKLAKGGAVKKPGRSSFRGSK